MNRCAGDERMNPRQRPAALTPRPDLRGGFICDDVDGSGDVSGTGLSLKL